MTLGRYDDALRDLEGRGLSRSLRRASGLDFTSNDYLAVSSADRIRTVLREALDRDSAVGAGGSRLLRGNHPAHEELEHDAARFFGAQGALYFGSGYMANFALMTTLPQRGDLILFDSLIHASAMEGLHASHSKRCKIPHNDADAVSDALHRWRRNGGKGQAWILVESLYSMDGDRAPLSDLVAIADHFEAILIVDEAHATGVFGPGGRGFAASYGEHENIVTLHTCGKALGVMGALVCARKTLIDYLINRSRPFIYSTAPSPLMAIAVKEALSIIAKEPQRREALRALYTTANHALKTRCGVQSSGSQIIPVLIGTDRAAVSTAEAMQSLGYDIRAIRPPTVPDGTARLRITITLHRTETEIEQMSADLADILKETGPIESSADTSLQLSGKFGAVVP